jgi:hypothetical protein
MYEDGIENGVAGLEDEVSELDQTYAVYAAEGADISLALGHAILRLLSGKALKALIKRSHRHLEITLAEKRRRSFALPLSLPASAALWAALALLAWSLIALFVPNATWRVVLDALACVGVVGGVLVTSRRPCPPWTGYMIGQINRHARNSDARHRMTSAARRAAILATQNASIQVGWAVMMAALVICAGCYSLVPYSSFDGSSAFIGLGAFIIFMMLTLAFWGSAWGVKRLSRKARSNFAHTSPAWQAPVLQGAWAHLRIDNAVVTSAAFALPLAIMALLVLGVWEPIVPAAGDWHAFAATRAGLTLGYSLLTLPVLLSVWAFVHYRSRRGVRPQPIQALKSATYHDIKVALRPLHRNKRTSMLAALLLVFALSVFSPLASVILGLPLFFFIVTTANPKAPPTWGFRKTRLLAAARSIILGALGIVLSVAIVVGGLSTLPRFHPQAALSSLKTVKLPEKMVRYYKSHGKAQQLDKVRNIFQDINILLAPIESLKSVYRDGAGSYILTGVSAWPATGLGSKSLRAVLVLLLFAVGWALSLVSLYSVARGVRWGLFKPVAWNCLL